MNTRVDHKYVYHSHKRGQARNYLRAVVGTAPCNAEPLVNLAPEALAGLGRESRRLGLRLLCGRRVLHVCGDFGLLLKAVLPDFVRHKKTSKKFVFRANGARQYYFCTVFTPFSQFNCFNLTTAFAKRQQ